MASGGEGAGHIRRSHLHHLDVARFDPHTFMARKSSRRSSEKRLGMATVRPRISAKVLTGPSFLHHHGAAVAVTQIHDLDRNALRAERDRQRSDDERRLHLVGNERFLDLGKALEQARQKDLAVRRRYFEM